MKINASRIDTSSMDLCLRALGRPPLLLNFCQSLGRKSGGSRRIAILRCLAFNPTVQNWERRNIENMPHPRVPTNTPTTFLPCCHVFRKRYRRPVGAPTVPVVFDAGGAEQSTSTRLMPSVKLKKRKYNKSEKAKEMRRARLRKRAALQAGH